VRFLKFVKTLYVSSNTVIKSCLQLVFEGSGSAVSNSLTAVCEIFRCRRVEFATLTVARVRVAQEDQLFEAEEMVAVAGLLRDLLAARYYSLIDSPINLNDLNFAIHT
jgi:hypothetical protein